MNDQCRLIGFVATSAGHRLLEASRRQAAAAGGRVVVTVACSTDKIHVGLLTRILGALLT